MLHLAFLIICASTEEEESSASTEYIKVHRLPYNVCGTSTSSLGPIRTRSKLEIPMYKGATPKVAEVYERQDLVRDM